MAASPTPDYQRGRAEALLQVASHLRQYAQATRPEPSWWPCERFRAEGRTSVLAQLEAFAGQLEAEGKRSPKSVEPCGCRGSGVLARIRRWLP